MELEKRGRPTAAICTDEFLVLGLAIARSRGLADLPIVVVRHPITTLTSAQVEELAPRAVAGVVAALTAAAQASPETGAEEETERITAEDSLEAVNELFGQRKWTDGLPIVPPTEARVQRMLAHADRAPGEVVSILPPRWARATVEKVAINAVMAGCKPEYLPVVLAAVEAVAEEDFNLAGIQATTNPATPMVIVNGPVAKALDINGGPNAMGPGWQANATIGRALRLILMNIGGGLPGSTDKSCQGQPGKYTFCLAENEAQNPWLPLHVERGFPAEASTVTVVGATGTSNMIIKCASAAELLPMLAGSMTGLGSNNYLLGGEPLVLLCPEHAAVLAREGLSKEAVKRYLFEHSQVPLGRFSPMNIGMMEAARRREFATWDADTLIPLAQRPEDIMIVVAGGASLHSTFIPTFGHTRAVTKPLLRKDGNPISFA